MPAVEEATAAAAAATAAGAAGAAAGATCATRGVTLQQQKLLLEPRHPPPEEALSADGAVDVFVRSHVMSLSAVDSKEQRFEALVWLQLEWVVCLPVAHPAATKWRPELTILNFSRNSAANSKPPTFRAVAEGEEKTRCFLAYTTHGEFVHRFDLRSFPFDTQTLAVHGVMWRSPLERVMPRAGAEAEDGDAGEVECVPFRGRLQFHMGKHILYHDNFVQRDVWLAPRGHEAVTVRAGHTDERHRGAADGQRFSTLTIEITLKRRHQFYMYNVVLPFNLFVCLSFISFAVEIPGGILSDRTTITLNMVLTAAAFKVVVSNYIPAVGYLTLLDAYLLLCFLFLSAVAAANVAISMAPDETRARLWNRNIGISLASAWGGVHLLLPIVKRVARLQYRADVRARDAREAADVRRWHGSDTKRFRSAAPGRPPTD